MEQHIERWAAEDIKGGYFDEAAKRGAEFLKNKHADGIENESSRHELWKVQKLLALAKYKQAIKRSKVSALVAFRAWAKGKAFAKKLRKEAWLKESALFYRRHTLANESVRGFRRFRRLYPSAPDEDDSWHRELKLAYASAVASNNAAIAIWAWPLVHQQEIVVLLDGGLIEVTIRDSSGRWSVFAQRARRKRLRVFVKAISDSLERTATPLEPVQLSKRTATRGSFGADSREEPQLGVLKTRVVRENMNELHAHHRGLGVLEMTAHRRTCSSAGPAKVTRKGQLLASARLAP